MHGLEKYEVIWSLEQNRQAGVGRQSEPNIDSPKEQDALADVKKILAHSRLPAALGIEGSFRNRPLPQPSAAINGDQSGGGKILRLSCAVSLKLNGSKDIV
jgi:hypothetical protein